MREHRLLGGVAAGLACHVGLSPRTLRITFVALSGLFDAGVGLMLYTVFWTVLPQQPPANQPTPRRDPAAMLLYLLLGVAAVTVSSIASDTRDEVDLSELPVIAIVAGIGVIRHCAEALRLSRNDCRLLWLRVLAGTLMVTVGVITGGMIVALILFIIAAVTAAVLWRGINQLRAEYQARIREQHHTRLAAAIHDQTLQNLVLMERNASNVQLIRELAHTQERALRGYR
ncbi:PspC domain-containing protein [Actinoplanes sp. NPDC051346]|uniref:PspC domain-containing protein n=1 Tax=Actinoplanes sp. NPDC051346 TaxID=3155048 RepID=UPI003434AB74